MQARHELDPAIEYVLGMHALHIVLPDDEENNPAAHDAHTNEPAALE